MISIIIPAYNEENYLPKTLRSLENQSLQDFEVIVVANGCTDNTSGIAKSFDAKVISIESQQIGAARNTGANQAKGDILVFLDADTTLSFNAISIISQQFTSRYAVGTIHSTPDVQKSRYYFVLGVKNWLHRLGLYRGSTGVIITHKKVFDKVLFPNLSVKENKLFINKTLKHGDYFYTSNSNSVTSMRRYEKWGLVSVWWFWIKKFIKLHKQGLKKEEKYEAVR